MDIIIQEIDQLIQQIEEERELHEQNTRRMRTRLEHIQRWMKNENQAISRAIIRRTEEARTTEQKSIARNEAAVKKHKLWLEENYVQVYTDGSCINNPEEPNRKLAGIGVFFNPRNRHNTCMKVLGEQTNIRGEIMAIIQAIRIAAKLQVTRLKINTDSELTIRTVEEYIPRWEENEWKTSQGRAIQNLELILQLRNTIKRLEGKLEVSFRFIKAHVGHFGNEEADKLAKNGCKAEEVWKEAEEC